jgi:hypothetical protein
MTVLSYFAVHEQLEIQNVSKRFYFMVARTQESKQFRVRYFTQEYTDTRKLRNAHQNLGYSQGYDSYSAPFISPSASGTESC